MSQQSLLIRVAAILDREGVAYMLTGSTASSIHGEPRSTHDIDLVVSLQSGAIEGLLAGFPEPDFYLSEDAIRNALRQRTMFNLIDVTTGDKVDFWMLTDEPFDQSRFGRRRPIELFGCRVFVSSPEDTILQKLHWSRRAGGSAQQQRDALAVYELQFAQLDGTYLAEWAARLGVEEELERLRASAEPLS